MLLVSRVLWSGRLERFAGFGRRVPARQLATASVLALALAGCGQPVKVSYREPDEAGKAEAPVAAATQARMADLNMDKEAPILIRAYKEDSKFEVWKKNRGGKFEYLASYDICRWSGKLGPKIKEGDRQAPEGFYTITPGQMNPYSHYFLSFNTGFPNEYDRSLGRTGADLMVHGSCSSAGCYAMSDANIEQIYALARDAFKGGQHEFQLQIYPFRMTATNMAKHWDDPNIAFWKMLKEGNDHFEVTHQEPRVAVCGHQYVFDASPVGGSLNAASPCPELHVPQSIEMAVRAKQKSDDDIYRVAVLEVQKQERIAAEQQREDAEQQRAIAMVEEKSRADTAAAAQREQDRQEALARLDANGGHGLGLGSAFAGVPILGMFASRPATSVEEADLVELQPSPIGAELPRPNPQAGLPYNGSAYGSAGVSTRVPADAPVAIAPAAVKVASVSGSVSSSGLPARGMSSGHPALAQDDALLIELRPSPAGAELPKPNPQASIAMVTAPPASSETTGPLVMTPQPAASGGLFGFFGKMTSWLHV